MSATLSALVRPNTIEINEKLSKLNLTGSPAPLKLGNSLDKYPHTDSTPTIGTEFERGVQLSELLKAPNADELIRDLAILGESKTTVFLIRVSILTSSIVSQRGVVFFRDQDINIEDQKILGTKLGELSGKPDTSKLHVHPITEESSELGDEVSVISSERAKEYDRGSEKRDRSKLSA